jgi:VCBS repeat-containing protein
LLWHGSPPSQWTDGLNIGLYIYEPENCSNIIVSGNYIEGSKYGLFGWPASSTAMGTLAGNTIAGLHDACFLNWLPTEMGSNQWGGVLMFVVPGQQNLDYAQFLAWAQTNGYESLSAGMATGLIDPSGYNSQLDAGLSLAQATAIFRSYARLKVNSFASCPAVAQSSTLGGTSTADINGTSPQAVNDAWSLGAGTTLVVNAAKGVLANDSDPDKGTLTAVLVSGPAHGQLTLNSDGSFSYTAWGSDSYTDKFTYLVSDGHGGTAMATVVLKILPS